MGTPSYNPCPIKIKHGEGFNVCFLASFRSVSILSCSRCKIQELGLVTTIERYDGPVFQLVRRFLKSDKPEKPDIHILSVGFGIISTTKPILNYDCKMTKECAQDLQPTCDDTLRKIVAAEAYRDICVCEGQIYCSK